MKNLNKISKKLLTLFVMLILVALMQKNVWADEEQSLGEYVTDFANEICIGYEVHISSVQEIYDDTSKYGYCINFESCNVPCGYVIYSERLGEIEEFCLDYGVNGISDNIAQKENNPTDIYRESVWEYDKLKGHITNYNTSYNGKLVGASDKYVDIFSMVMDKPDVADNNNYELETYNYLKYRSMYSEDDITNWGLNKGCAPIAILNVCKQSGFFSNFTHSELKDAYKKIRKIARTNAIGNTHHYLIGYTVKKYAKSEKNITIDYTYNEWPKSSYFINAVNKNYSSILGFIVGKGENKVGHTVSVNGYFKYKNKTDGTTKIYLQVADGWYSKTRSILYSQINDYDIFGIVFKYKTRN